MMKGNILLYAESLNCFTLFSEYFIAVSIIYTLIAVTLIMPSYYGLILQKAISECISLILFMACFIIVNDDIFKSLFEVRTPYSYKVNDFITYMFYSHIYYNSISMDNFAIFTKFLVCFFSAIYFLLIADSLKEQKLTSFEYLIILLSSVLSLVLMCSSNDLLLTYLLIELSSLSCYVLASFKKTSSYSVDSGIKYFITGAISSALFLLGSSFLYGITGSINFSDFHYLVGWHYTFSDFIYHVNDGGYTHNPVIWELLF
jgi:NADH:ubiquinone oxidoreductase subunit 2 (subunit N)